MILSRLSPLPIVDLRNIDIPSGGLLVATPKACARNYYKGPECRDHYQHLALDPQLWGKPVQCPYGFSSYAVSTGRQLCCLTGIIPFPRLGGAREAEMAKGNPKAKMSLDGVKMAAQALIDIERHLESIEAAILEREAFSLHEIRKLNRTIKQEAERLCTSESPADPSLANPQLVKIWKSSDLMSTQFDVIELLANETLFALPCTSLGEVYRIVDKCVRIYRPSTNPSRVHLKAPYGFDARVFICDKTFQIIPTVLIENALKYSLPNSQIIVEFHREGGNVVVSFTNQFRSKKVLTEDIFKKGYRLSVEQEGSGNGLYLAMMVAKQHQAKLTVVSEPIALEAMLCKFVLSVPEAITF